MSSYTECNKLFNDIEKNGLDAAQKGFFELIILKEYLHKTGIKGLDNNYTDALHNLASIIED